VATYAIQKSCFGAHRNRAFESASIPVIAWVANEWKDKMWFVALLLKLLRLGETLCIVYKCQHTYFTFVHF